LYLTDFLKPEHISELPIHFIRHAWHELEQHADQTKQYFFIKEAFLPLLWWVRTTRPIVDKNQQRSGWRYWQSAYEDWVELQISNDKPKDWAVAARLRHIHYGLYVAIPLSQRIELIEEAEAMHNCLADFNDDCAASLCLAFSIRDQQSH